MNALSNKPLRGHLVPELRRNNLHAINLQFRQEKDLHRNHRMLEGQTLVTETIDDFTYRRGM